MVEMYNILIANRNLARKNGEFKKALVLSTLIGEVDRKRINRNNPIPDCDIAKEAKSLIESNKITNTTDENIFLQEYLLPELSDVELNKIIDDNFIPQERMKNMGRIMQYLSTNFSGRYDGKIASDYIKSKLNQYGI